MLGGSNCALHGRPQGLPIVSPGPFSSEDFQMGSPVGDGNTSPRSSGDLSLGGRESCRSRELPLEILLETKYIQCVSVAVSSTIFLPFPTETPF